MEQRGMVEGAQRAHVNLLRRNAREGELIARRAPQIEMRLRIPREPLGRLHV
jgi:hypothetical protein